MNAAIKYISLVVFFIAISCNAYGETKEINIDYVFEKVLTTSPIFHSEITKLSSSSLEKRFAQASALPNVGLTIGSNQIRSNSNSDFLDLIFNNATTLTMTQQIFNFGGTIDSLRKADASIEAANSAFLEAKQSILLNTAKIYMSVAKQRKFSKLAQNNVEVLNKFLTLVEARFQKGYATLTDIARAKSRLEDAKSKSIKSQENLMIAESEFYRLVGEKPNYKLKIPHTFPSLPDDFSTFLEQTIQSSPELIKDNHLLRAKELEVNITRSALMPSLSVNANHYIKNTRDTDSDAYSSLNLSLSIPIFTAGGKNLIELERKKLELQIQKYYNLDKQRSINGKAVTLWHAVQSAHNRVLSTKATAESAKLALEGIFKEHEHGFRTSFDVLTAKQEHFEANLAFEEARYDLIISVYSALAIIGQLGQEIDSVNT